MKPHLYALVKGSAVLSTHTTLRGAVLADRRLAGSGVDGTRVLRLGPGRTTQPLSAEETAELLKHTNSR